MRSILLLTLAVVTFVGQASRAERIWQWSTDSTYDREVTRAASQRTAAYRVRDDVPTFSLSFQYEQRNQKGGLVYQTESPVQTTAVIKYPSKQTSLAPLTDRPVTSAGGEYANSVETTITASKSEYEGTRYFIRTNFILLDQVGDSVRLRAIIKRSVTRQLPSGLLACVDGEMFSREVFTRLGSMISIGFPEKPRAKALEKFIPANTTERMMMTYFIPNDFSFALERDTSLRVVFNIPEPAVVRFTMLDAETHDIVYERETVCDIGSFVWTCDAARKRNGAQEVSFVATTPSTKYERTEIVELGKPIIRRRLSSARRYMLYGENGIALQFPSGTMSPLADMFAHAAARVSLRLDKWEFGGVIAQDAFHRSDVSRYDPTKIHDGYAVENVRYIGPFVRYTLADKMPDEDWQPALGVELGWSVGGATNGAVVGAGIGTRISLWERLESSVMVNVTTFTPSPSSVKVGLTFSVGLQVF